MAGIFRQKALDKLSSPDQLDKMIIITPPSAFIGLIGAFIIVLALLVWGIFGKLPENQSVNGVYIGTEGIYSVGAGATGVVSEVLVHDGDYVEKGDPIARLDCEDLDATIDELNDRIDVVDSVTMDSEGDIVNSDTKNLVDTKNQLLTINQTLNADLSKLGALNTQLANQITETDAANKKMLAAETAYYSAMASSDTTGAQASFQDASTQYSSALSVKSSTESSYYNAVGQKNSYAAQLAVYEADAAEAKRKYNRLSSSEVIPPDDPDYVEDSLRAGEAERWEGLLSDALTRISICKQSIVSCESQIDGLKKSLDEANGTLNTKAWEYEDEKKRYVNAVASGNAAQIEAQKQQNEYSKASNEYANAKSQLKNVRDSIAQMEVQIANDKDVVANQTEYIQAQFDATKSAILDQLQKELDNYLDSKDANVLSASVSGKITNINLVEGSVVQQGASIAKVMQDDESGVRKVFCYVPVTDGKKISVGMSVMVYPTTVNRQEYGHMEATVTKVSEYVVSGEEIRNILGSEELAQSFLQNGPVILVECELMVDETTASGYYWSNRKGRTVELTDGTIVSADVVLNENPPITKLIPYIKEKLAGEKKKEQ